MGTLCFGRFGLDFGLGLALVLRISRATARAISLLKTAFLFLAWADLSAARPTLRMTRFPCVLTADFTMGASFRRAGSAKRAIRDPNP